MVNEDKKMIKHGVYSWNRHNKLNLETDLLDNLILNLKANLSDEKETAKQMCFSLERKKPTLKKKLDSDIIPPSDMFFTRGQLYMLNKIIEEIKQKYGVEK